MGFLDSENALAIVRGSSKTFRLTVETDAGAPQDLTGARVVFSMKGQSSDRTPVLVKDSSGGSPTIVITDPRAGVAEVRFVPADTHTLNPGVYLFDAWVVFPSEARVPVIPESTLEVLDSITRIPLS